LLPVSGEKGAAFQQLSDNVREREKERERERGKEGEISGPFVLSYNGPLATPLPYPPRNNIM